MKIRSILSLCSLCLGAVVFTFSASTAFSQAVAPQAASTTGVLARLSTAFSGSAVIHQVQLSGTATWYAGSLEDSGTASLTATNNGSSQMQLSLNTKGQITEAQTGSGSSAHCQWSGADQVSHNVDVGTCWRPTLWFLPALSLQPSVLSKEQSINDLGEGTVGFGSTVYRHLQGQIVPSEVSTSNTAVSNLIQETTTDIGLDPGTFLPAVLAYSVHPNGGAPIAIAIEIHYSDYRAVSGAQIPFHIERYVNGSLQLDIHVNSATLN